MSKTAYLFETRSVQRFLFDGGKLRDMVSASDQLDALCSSPDTPDTTHETHSDTSNTQQPPSPLDLTLAACGVKQNEGVRFSRRAGGSVYALFDEKAKARQFQMLWSYYVRQHFPGVELVQVVANGATDTEAMTKALGRLAEQRNRVLAQVPVPGPLVRRSPRTGEPAVAYHNATKEWVDDATRIKRKHNSARSSLLPKFADDWKNYQWPTTLDQEEGGIPFPFLGEDRTVALVHADGNGLGEVLRLLSKAVETVVEKGEGDQFARLFLTFSQAMERATTAAAKVAMHTVLQNLKSGAVVPARPLVLGGDDLTLLIRADLALPFTQAFCNAFETKAASFLLDLKRDVEAALADAPDELKELSVNRLTQLTASAGVAFIKASQPFLQTHDLAETLCRKAKDTSRASLKTEGEGDAQNELIDASISFHHVSGALIEKIADVSEHEWTVSIEGKDKLMAMGAYRLRNNPTGETQLPDFDTLNRMAKLFGEDKLNRNGLRQIAMLLRENPDQAQQRYRRWRDIAEKTETGKKQLHMFDTEMQTLIDLEHPDDLPFDKGTNHSPLLDLLVVTGINAIAAGADA